MQSNMQSKKFYRWAAIILFFIEVFIAVEVPSESFIRHSMGDFLVVILLYCLIKSFITMDSNKVIIGVLLFSFAIEFSQYFHLVDILGITNTILRVIMGTSFSISDLFMYGFGSLTIYLYESRRISLN